VLTRRGALPFAAQPEPDPGIADEAATISAEQEPQSGVRDGRDVRDGIGPLDRGGIQGRQQIRTARQQTVPREGRHRVRRGRRGFRRNQPAIRPDRPAGATMTRQGHATGAHELDPGGRDRQIRPGLGRPDESRAPSVDEHRSDGGDIVGEPRHEPVEPGGFDGPDGRGQAHDQGLVSAADTRGEQIYRTVSGRHHHHSRPWQDGCLQGPARDEDQRSRRRVRHGDRADPGRVHAIRRHRDNRHVE